MKVEIVTGLSGAGKTQASICLEDMGYFCVDNMPPVLIGSFLDIVGTANNIEKAAFMIDIRGGRFFPDFKKGIKSLKDKGIDYRIIFLEATDEVLIRRYNETRREHPYHSLPIEKAIAKERTALEEIRDMSDFIIDTSGMKPIQLREEIRGIILADSENDSFSINIMSFGYKHGIPIEADLVFDVRFLPNPYYVPSLKKLTGNNKKVRNYVMKNAEAQEFTERLSALIDFTIPYYIKEDKHHLNIAFGCTGGQHRSVSMANEFAELFESRGKKVTINHRDVKE